jgi:hypothetical protein
MKGALAALDVLPAAPLRDDGPTAARFRALGVGDFAAAARYLQALPYGRISNRGAPELVLTEGRGTCTTKHALLARLAREQGVPVTLTLGIFEMHEGNTPGVGEVLTRHGLPYVPEAHCYLVHGGTRVDITRLVEAAEPIARFLHEEPITPEQIGDYKIGLHRGFLAGWIGTEPAARGRTLDELWRIREACIAALSEPR